MNVLETVSLIAAIISVIIGLLAIWLSIQFYIMSSKSSEDTRNASKDISSSVARLEKLFDRFYSDTFSVMKETYSDMRRHIWPEQPRPEKNVEEEAEKRADKEVDKLKEEASKELAEVIKKQADTNEAKIRELRALMNRAISGSRRAEAKAREETIREFLLDLIRNMEEHSLNMTADSIIHKTAGRFPFELIISELEKMEQDKLIKFSTPTLGPRTIINIR